MSICKEDNYLKEHVLKERYHKFIPLFSSDAKNIEKIINLLLELQKHL